MVSSDRRSSESFLSDPHAKEVDEVLSACEVERGKGLSEEEARRRLEQYGPNELKEQQQKSLFRILLDQLNNPVIYLLVAAATLAFIFGDVPAGIAIVVVILLNTAIGFWMEYQARRSIESLREMDKVQARVIREGEEKTIDAEQLAPGDVILLEAGDLVTADARLLEVSELSVDESALTGESVPVSKAVEPVEADKQVGDRTCMVFKGTAVANGNGRAVVVSTGMDTEIGSISQMVSSAEKEQIPLNQKLQVLSRRLIWATLGLAATFFLFGWWAGKDTYQLIQTAVAWAIAAIPEGLPIVASIALAKGMLRLADQRVIMKRLAAVETLGETTVIFTDKTGTLTEDKLTLEAIRFAGWEAHPERDKDGRVKLVPDDGEQISDDAFEQLSKCLLRVSVFCNDASLDTGAEDEESGGEGDPVDLALLQFARAWDPEGFEHLNEVERIAEEPFDSEDMVMGAVNRVDEQLILSGKGAAEAVLPRCTRILTPEGEQSLSDSGRQEWLDRNESMSRDGLRVIALAWKELDEKPSGETDVEEELMQDMTFLALVGFLDPPRADVEEAVRTCQKAGIKVEMITGDHPGTAQNIARQVAIAEEGKEQVIHGENLDLEEASPEDLSDIRVYARVSPKEKLDIVTKSQEAGEIVAMTGDGVNDAPALKKADIGIAMGKRGTQVAKEVADMVIEDDAFPSILDAIREGRIIFGNIRKFIIYQLSYHLSEIVVIAAVSFTLYELPLLPLQLLFLNLLSDVFPALALGIGEGTAGVMQKPPKDPKEPVLTGRHWTTIALYGAILAVSIGGAYFWGYFYWDLSPAVCNNIAFFTLALAQLWHVFNMREPFEPFFNNQITRNPFIWGALALCVTAIGTAYFVPFLREVLSLQLLSPEIWGLIMAVSLLPVLVIQLIMAFRRN